MDGVKFAVETRLAASFPPRVEPQSAETRQAASLHERITGPRTPWVTAPNKKGIPIRIPF